MATIEIVKDGKRITCTDWAEYELLRDWVIDEALGDVDVIAPEEGERDSFVSAMDSMFNDSLDKLVKISIKTNNPEPDPYDRYTVDNPPNHGDVYYISYHDNTGVSSPRPWPCHPTKSHLKWLKDGGIFRSESGCQKYIDDKAEADA